MTFDIDILTNPSDLGRRLIIPLARFNDDDIRSGDFPSWKATEEYYHCHWQEQLKIKRLMKSIASEGLRQKVEIWWDGPETTGYRVYNGHHRVIALKRLGCTHVPYRWFCLHRGPRAFGRKREIYQRKALPPQSF